MSDSKTFNNLLRRFRSEISSRFLFQLLFVGLLTLHFFRMTAILPLEKIITWDPMITGNHSLDYAALLRDRAMEDRSGLSWGYDPFVGAGRLSGFPIEREARAVVIFDRVLRKLLKPEQSQKLFFFFILFFSPFLLYGAVRQFGLSRSVGLWSIVFALIIFSSYELDGWDMMLHGHHSALVSFYLSLFCLAVFYRAILFSAPWRLWLKYSFILAGLLLLNPHSLLLLIGPALYMVFKQRQKWAWRNVFFTVGAAGLAVLLNWSWIGPWFKLPDNFSSIPVEGPIPLELLQFYFSKSFAWIDWAPRLILGIFSFFYVFGLLGLRSSQSFLSGLFLSSLIPAAWLGAGAPGVPFLASFHLGRFQQSFLLFQIIPAAWAVNHFFTRWGIAGKIFATWFMWFLLSAPLANRDGLPRPFMGNLSQSQSLFLHLSKISSPARLLWEDHLASNHLQELFPILFERSIIGTVHPRLPWASQRKTVFLMKSQEWAPFMFGKYLSTYTKEDLQKDLNLYNVSHVIASSLQSRSRFDRYRDVLEPMPPRKEFLTNKKIKMKGFHPERPLDPIRIYRVKSTPHSYFLKGSGNLKLDFNRIEISRASKGEIILKFHDHPFLRLKGGKKNSPIKIGRDLVPFISLTNPKDGATLVLTFMP